MSAHKERAQVPAELDGERIDKALAALLPGMTRHLAKKVLDMGAVMVARHGKERRVRRASEPVHKGEVLSATWHPDVLVAEKFDLVVLHEDEDVVVIDKPSGQLSQGSELGDVGSLAWALMRRYGQHVRLMHRLDKGASGIMVAGRNLDATAALTPQFREHTIERRYVAVTRGVPPAGPCEVPILMQGRLVRAARPDEQGVPARSDVTVRATFEVVGGVAGVAGEVVGEVAGEVGGAAPRELRAEVEVQLYTGRTHQIRIHLQSLGAPIVGDPQYGGPPAERMCLHAATLGFVHPRGHALRFESPPPADFVRAAGLPG